MGAGWWVIPILPTGAQSSSEAPAETLRGPPGNCHCSLWVIFGVEVGSYPLSI